MKKVVLRGAAALVGTVALVGFGLALQAMSATANSDSATAQATPDLAYRFAVLWFGTGVLILVVAFVLTRVDARSQHRSRRTEPEVESVQLDPH